MAIAEEELLRAEDDEAESERDRTEVFNMSDEAWNGIETVECSQPSEESTARKPVAEIPLSWFGISDDRSKPAAQAPLKAADAAARRAIDQMLADTQ